MSIKLLIVDDDINDIESLTDIILEISPDIKISVTKDGNEMIRLLESQEQLPDFIFLDLNMPIKTGIECLTEIRSNEKWKDIKIVVLTTSTHREQINEVYKMGADLYIRKPNSYSAFKDILNKCLQMDWGFEKKVNALENKDNPINFFDSSRVYNDIVENIALGIVVINFFQDGSFFISYTNKEFHKIAATSSDEIDDENSNYIFESTHPDDLAFVQAAIRQLFELKEFDIEFRMVAAGKTKNIRSQGKPIYNKSGNCITAYIYFNDITEQVKNQNSLKESEEKYKFMFENAPQPMFIWDFETLNILDANNKATELYGYTREEFTKLNIRQIRPTEDISLIEAATKNLESYWVDSQRLWRHLKKNGELMYVEVTAHVFELNGKLISIAHNQDITEKIKAEEELKLMDFAFKKSATPIMLLLPNGEFYSFNDALLNLLGYTKEEFSKLNLLNVATTMNEASCIKQWDEIREKRSVAFECHFERKDGVLLDVEVSSNLINYNEYEVNFCYINDITKRKKATERLKLSDHVIQKATTAIYLLKSDGSIYNFNEAAYTMLGYTKEELAMLNQMDLDPLLNLGIIAEGFDVLRGEGKVYFQATMVKKGGDLIDVEITSTFIVYDGLELKCSFISEISEKKKAAAEIYSINELLQRQTNRLLLATKSAQLGIWEWDLVSDSIIWDEMMYQLYGISPNEFNTVDEGWIARLHEEDRTEIFKEIQLSIKNEKDYNTEFRIVWSDSSIRYLRATGIVERVDGKPKRMIGVSWDVTAEKENEQHLKLLESVIINTKDSIMITEAEPFDEPGPRIIFVNPAFEKMTGYTSEEVIGLTPRLLQGPKSDKTELKRLSEAIRRWETCEITTINYKKNGEEFWINFSVSPVANKKGWFTHWIAVERDITDRKQAEEELKKSAEFSGGILNSINSCIAVLNKNGDIIKTNQAWKIMSASAEMSKANFIREGNFLDILDKYAVEGNVLAKDTIVGLKDVMNERTSIYKNQYYFKPTNTNDEWWFDIVVSGFQNQSDMVIINIQDITDLKNIEKERDNTQEANINLQKIELELSNALAKEKDLNELKSRFVTMASHEFRTPLTTIMSSLSLISRYAENADTEGQVKHISKIKKSVFTLTDILDDFLSASKLEEGKIENDPKEINLKNFIGDIVLEMQSTATDGRTIVEKYHAKEMATIDQKLLKNIMFNLLSNAIKFSKASGIIEVVIEEFEDSIVIAVKDNGIGISKEDQKHLFQRFYRGYNATHIQGTGLGLNIVAKYAEVMKASLTYESIENKGSIFSLKIPQ